jgi:hypothetical protein
MKKKKNDQRTTEKRSKNNKITDELLLEIIQEISHGKTLKECSEKYQISYTWLRQKLSKVKHNPKTIKPKKTIKKNNKNRTNKEIPKKKQNNDHVVEIIPSDTQEIIKFNDLRDDDDIYKKIVYFINNEVMPRQCEDFKDIYLKQKTLVLAFGIIESKKTIKVLEEHNNLEN